jgi:hypothetical protein
MKNELNNTSHMTQQYTEVIFACASFILYFKLLKVEPHFIIVYLLFLMQYLTHSSHVLNFHCVNQLSITVMKYLR